MKRWKDHVDQQEEVREEVNKKTKVYKQIIAVLVFIILAVVIRGYQVKHVLHKELTDAKAYGVSAYESWKRVNSSLIIAQEELETHSDTLTVSYYIESDSVYVTGIFQDFNTWTVLTKDQYDALFKLKQWRSR